MLASRGNLLSFCYSDSLGTFIKHFRTSKLTSFKLNTLDRKHTTTSAPLKTSHFETLSPRQKEQIHVYVDALLLWNQKMNLTAVREESEVMERHIEDSLAIIPPIRSSYISNCGASCDDISLVDVGSGAGLPGLVLAIACPGWKVKLLESMNKRCIFLEHAIELTGLSNVQVVRGRAERTSKNDSSDRHYYRDLGQNLDFREAFDVAVARAVAEMRVLAEYCLPLVRVGGLFVAAKGHDPQDEVERADRAINLMGASLLQTLSVESHSPRGQRTAIICLKDCSTPRKYPRDPGTPVKLPL